MVAIEKVNEVKRLASGYAARMGELAGVLNEQSKATTESSRNVSTLAQHAKGAGLRRCSPMVIAMVPRRKSKK